MREPGGGGNPIEYIRSVTEKSYHDQKSVHVKVHHTVTKNYLSISGNVEKKTTGDN